MIAEAEEIRLNCDTVDAKPVDYDFDPERYDLMDGAGWREIRPTFEDWPEDELRAWIEDRGSVDDIPEDEWGEDELREKCCELADEEPDGWYPVMSYAYPLPENTDAEQVANDLERSSLPLTVVEINGAPYLALTGGGMDLSWEICAAYVIAGYMPPAHFARNLPRMAGNEERERATWPHCRRSLEVQSSWNARALERGNEHWGE